MEGEAAADDVHQLRHRDVLGHQELGPVDQGQVLLTLEALDDHRDLWNGMGLIQR